MSSLIEIIVRALFEANNCVTPAGQAEYLRSLRPAVRALWDAYRDPSGVVHNPQYVAAATQAVYMLRYFPGYTQLLPTCLSAQEPGHLVTMNDPIVRAAYFGAGPAPEVYGTLQFLTGL